MNAKKNTYSFEDFDYMPIEDILVIETEGDVVKFQARSVTLNEPVHVIESDKKYGLVTSATFQDRICRRTSANAFFGRATR